MREKPCIKSRLMNLLNKKYHIAIDNDRDICNEELLGASINMGAIDLMSLLLDVEREFKIRIIEEDIVKGKFRTVNGICDLVLEKQIANAY